MKTEKDYRVISAKGGERASKKLFPRGNQVLGSWIRQREHAALMRVDRLRLQRERIPNLAQQRRRHRLRLALPILAAVALAMAVAE